MRVDEQGRPVPSSDGWEVVEDGNAGGDGYYVDLSYFKGLDILGGSSQFISEVRERVEALCGHLAYTQGSLNKLGNFLVNSGQAANEKSGEVLQAIGAFQRAQSQAPQVKPWYKTPAVVIGSVVIVTVFTYKVFEGIGQFAYHKVVDFFSDRSVEQLEYLSGQEIKDVAVFVEKQKTQNYIEDRTKRSHRKDEL